jgi:predicted ATPase
MLAEHVARQGLVTRRPIALFYRAASAHAQGDATFDVIGGLQQAIAEFREFNYLARMPYYLGVLADAFASHGRLEDAHKALDSAFDCAVEQNERWCLPELLRIRSTVLIASSREEEAEAILLESIACAQEIGALSWRLRSATDLAKVWRARSRVDEAYKLLLPVYREFTEGFETHDLVAAAGLLASLERPGSGEAA